MDYNQAQTILFKVNDEDIVNGVFRLPENFTEIEFDAFKNTSVEKVYLNENITYIPSGTFYNCKNLTFVEIPKSVRFISKNAFDNCIKLEQISLPKKLQELGEGAFANCKSLKIVQIPENIKVLPDGLFDQSGVETVILPKGLLEINVYAFSGCENLKNIIIPKTVKVIKCGAFHLCKSLESIKIPKGVKTISSNVFAGCENLKSVALPKTLKHIKSGSFSSCKNLEDITLPNGLTELGAASFYRCDSLKSIKIPKKIDAISKECFMMCVNLERVEIAGKVDTIFNNAFRECRSLKEINLGNYLKRIGEAAFRYTGLQEVIMPDSVVSMGYYAFCECENLQKIKLSNNLSYISNNCFYGCKSLKEIELPEKIKHIEDGAFCACDSLTEIKLPSGIDIIKSNTFRYCESLESINTENIKTIEYSAFGSCKNLKNIDLQNVKKIESYAFSGCKNLTSLNLTNAEFIGENAFFDCKNLKQIYLSSNLKHIGESAFKGCDALEEIILDNTKIKISPEMRDNLDRVYDFLVYASKNKKFIPKNIAVMEHTKTEEIPKFYARANEWKDILSLYLKKHHDILLSVSKDAIQYATENLFQISTVLGLFQDGANGEMAKEFIINNIIDMTPFEIHKFGGFKVKEKGYNEEFAKFYMKNFKKSENGELDFFETKEIYGEDEEIVDYTTIVYNNWDKVKKAYPNRTVLADREQGSENNNLSVEDVIHAVKITIYENVLEGNEEMAEMVGCYGYTQYEFEKLQDWFEIAKKINPDDMTLKIAEDTEINGVTFKVLAKDDPEALILGEKTNCCQVVNNAGKSCVEYGMKAHNSCFVKFCVGDKLIGQSWVWYNEKTGVVCLDNIEVPTIWKKQLKKKEVEDSFLKCLTRLASSVKTEMQKNGRYVSSVNIGSGYNDVPGIEKFERINVSGKKVLPEDYSDYSDAKHTQFIIPSDIKTNEKIS